MRGIVETIHHLFLLTIKLGTLQQVGHADDRVERRTQLVADR